MSHHSRDYSEFGRQVSRPAAGHRRRLDRGGRRAPGRPHDRQPRSEALLDCQAGAYIRIRPRAVYPGLTRVACAVPFDGDSDEVEPTWESIGR